MVESKKSNPAVNMEWANTVTDGHRDKAICRCLGCGKFCNSRTLAQGDSLCVNCSASWQTYQEPRSVALEESGAAVELVRDYSMMKEIASSPCPANCGGFSNGSIDHTNEGIATGGTSQREIGLCARCWAAEGTSILYNSPVCDECFRQAKEKRVGHIMINQDEQETDRSIESGANQGDKGMRRYPDIAVDVQTSDVNGSMCLETLSTTYTIPPAWQAFDACL